MKKLLSLALILMVCCTSALLFAGCDSSKTFFMFATEGSSPAATAVENETDSEGRQVYNFDFEIYTGPESGRKKHEEDERKGIKINIYDSKPENLTAPGTAKESVTLGTLEARGANVTNFNLKYEGTRTAKISYDGASITFQYTVK